MTHDSYKGFLFNSLKQKLHFKFQHTSLKHYLSSRVKGILSQVKGILSQVKDILSQVIPLKFVHLTTIDSL